MLKLNYCDGEVFGFAKRNLNTSYVEVKHDLGKLITDNATNLNTSYVEVKLFKFHITWL